MRSTADLLLLPHDADGSRRRRRGACPVKAFARGLFGLLLAAAAGGCIQTPHTTISSFGGAEAGEQIDEAPEPQRIAALRDEFIHLDPSVDPGEAERLASTAVRYSNLMAERYDLIKPVELNNVLISAGLKRRGLCYQLAEDLLAELRTLHVKTLALQRCMAWKGDIWNEHNCVVVTAVGQAFEDGIVLDAWRNAGNLRWAPVRLDHYPWVPKPPPTGERESETQPTSGPATQPSTTQPSTAPSITPVVATESRTMLPPPPPRGMSYVIGRKRR
jgi:hypothetical protein